MKVASVAAILRAFNAANVRALVVGGLAVNAHGYLRFTKDADFVVELVPDNIERAFAALRTLGYQPLVPINAAQFSDPALRQSWIVEKEMKVLQFASDVHRETPIDVFVIEPFDFNEEFGRALAAPLALPGEHETIARYVAIPALIKMKAAVARTQDLDDIQHLEWIEEGRRG